MIQIRFNDPEFGEILSFKTPDQALLFAQDQLKEWRRSFRHIASAPRNDLSGAFTAHLAPIRAWETAADEIDRIRQGRSTAADEHIIDVRGLVMSSCNFAEALVWTAGNVGIKAAHYASILYGLTDGKIDWADRDACIGILMFDWSLRRTKSSVSDLDARSKSTLIEKNLEQAAYLLSSAKNAQKRLEAATESAADLTARYEAVEAAEHANARGKWQKLLEDAEGIKSVINGQFEQQRSIIDDATNQASATVQSWIEAQDEKRKLAAPAQLWSDRASLHANSATKLGISAIACGVIGLVLSFLIAESAFKFSGELFKTALINGDTSNTQLITMRLNPTFTY